MSLLFSPEIDKLLHFNHMEVQLLGQKQLSELMFYYVRMEDIIPEDHLLRLIKQFPIIFL